MESEKVYIACPSGHYLLTKSANKSTRSKESGTKYCNACKKQFRWELVGNKAFVYEIK